MNKNKCPDTDCSMCSGCDNNPVCPKCPENIDTDCSKCPDIIKSDCPECEECKVGNVVLIPGNDGTVSCNKFCQMQDGGWLYLHTLGWKGATCAGPEVVCKNVFNVPKGDKDMPCPCMRDDINSPWIPRKY